MGIRPHGVDKRLKIFRWRDFNGQVLARDRVLECEPGCMQRLPFETAQRLNQFLRRAFRQRQPAAIYRIANERMPTMGEMHPDLVGATSFKPHIDIGGRCEALFHGVMRYGRFAVTLHTHAFAVNWVSRNWLTDCATTR